MQETGSSNIREATQEDLFELLMLGYEFIKECPDHMKPFEKDVMEERLSNIIASEDGEVFVLEKDGEIQGLLVAMCSSPWMLSKKFGLELGLYIRKSARDGRGVIKLIKHYEAWAKSKGVTQVHMSDLSKLQNLSKLYERLGYSLIETNYIKEV